MRVSPVLTLATVLVGFGGAHAQVQVQQREPRAARPVPAIVQPVLIRSVQPRYTAEALRARVAGDVYVTAIVRADGTVAAAEIVKPLDPSLDELAREAVRQWLFRPGTVDGKPVAFGVTAVLDFRIPQPGASDAVVTMGVRVIGQAPVGVVAEPVIAGAPERGDQERVYRPGRGVGLPVPIRRVHPSYPTAAMRKKIQGQVHLEAVVLVDGTVGDVRVIKSLDLDLDQAAIEAGRQWKFTPGRVDGRAVPVLVTLVLEFRLAGGGTSGLPAIALPSALATGAQQPELTPEEFARGTYPDSVPGLKKPVAEHAPEPFYTMTALRLMVEGTVELDVVVLPDGTVGRARVAKSLEPSLDAEALAAVRTWKFTPGQLDGKPVPVLTRLTLQFRLR